MSRLTLASYASSLDRAIKSRDGLSLARAFALLDSTLGSASRLLLAALEQMDHGSNFRDGGNAVTAGGTPSIGVFSRTLKQEWADLATAHVAALIALNPLSDRTMSRLAPDPVLAFQRQHEVVNILYRYLISSRDPSTGWCLELLYKVCEDLLVVAQLADSSLVRKQQKPGKLEEASRSLQKCFSCCLNDRAGDWGTSRKMGTYHLATLLFKTYFKLNSTALCKNIIRGIQAAELPALDKFPRAHQIEYTYYMGVFAFLREEYTEAERKFTDCLEGIHRKAKQNISLILDYLIPLLLLRGSRPSDKLLQRQPAHRALFLPFILAMKEGNVRSYDAQLEREEKRLMERGTWLVVERAREVCVRRLLKKTWILQGKPSRVSIETFRGALNFALQPDLPADERTPKGRYDKEEMECLLANHINKDLIRGYISHTHGIVVLSKEKPFP